MLRKQIRNLPPKVLKSVKIIINYSLLFILWLLFIRVLRWDSAGPCYGRPEPRRLRDGVALVIFAGGGIFCIHDVHKSPCTAGRIVHDSWHHKKVELDMFRESQERVLSTLGISRFLARRPRWRCVFCFKRVAPSRRATKRAIEMHQTCTKTFNNCSALLLHRIFRDKDRIFFC